MTQVPESPNCLRAAPQGGVLHAVTARPLKTVNHQEFTLRIDGSWKQVEGDQGDVHLQSTKGASISLDLSSRPLFAMKRSGLVTQLDRMMDVGSVVSMVEARTGWGPREIERRSGAQWEQSISRSSNAQSGARLREVFTLTTRKVLKLRVLLHDLDDARADAVLEALLAGLEVRLP